MASLLNTSTLEILRSADETKYSAPWQVISDANASAWMAIQPQYRKLNGESIEEMTVQEKAVVDASHRQAARNAAAAQLEQQEDILRAFMLIVLDEFTLHAEKVNALGQAIVQGASLAAIKTALQGLVALPVRTERQLRDAIKAKLGS